MGRGTGPVHERRAQPASAPGQQDPCVDRSPRDSRRTGRLKSLNGKDRNGSPNCGQKAQISQRDKDDLDVVTGRQTLGNIETEVPPDRRLRPKENPPAAASGLSETNTGSLVKITGKRFVSTVSEMCEYRLIVEDLASYCSLLERGRKPTSFDSDETRHIRASIEDGQAILQALYRAADRRDFEAFFGSLEDFERSLDACECGFGGA